MFEASQQDPFTVTPRDPAVLGEGEHPIEILIKRAEAQHQAVQDKLAAVETLEDAVRDYEVMWRMPPPLGFDKW